MKLEEQNEFVLHELERRRLIGGIFGQVDYIIKHPSIINLDKDLKQVD